VDDAESEDVPGAHCGVHMQNAHQSVIAQNFTNGQSLNFSTSCQVTFFVTFSLLLSRLNSFLFFQMTLMSSLKVSIRSYSRALS
jgi:hypothetical protein